jgi:hypothetical protein
VTWVDATGNELPGLVNESTRVTGSGGFIFAPSTGPGETIGDLAVVMEDRCSTSNMLMVATQWETDTEFTLTVTDTITNQTKQYFNPQGTAPSSFFDFAAFATCPS